MSWRERECLVGVGKDIIILLGGHVRIMKAKIISIKAGGQPAKREGGRRKKLYMLRQHRRSQNITMRLN